MVYKIRKFSLDISLKNFNKDLTAMKNLISTGLIVSVCLFTIILTNNCSAQEWKTSEQESLREHLLMDFGWRFALGHSYDTKKDFDNGSGYFSYFAKAGYGDGAASENFDDRAWRILDLPHDWCVELPFDSTGGHSLCHL